MKPTEVINTTTFFTELVRDIYAVVSLDTVPNLAVISSTTPRAIIILNTAIIDERARYAKSYRKLYQ